MGVDKYSDVLDSEVAECDFTDVYMRSISHPSKIAESLYPVEAEMKQLRRIPGISALRHAAPESIPELEAKYPDTAFALMISDNLFVGDRELNEIHQKAYTAILRGESIPGVRFRYDYDTESYLRRHMWD